MPRLVMMNEWRHLSRVETYASAASRGAKQHAAAPTTQADVSRTQEVT